MLGISTSSVRSRWGKNCPAPLPSRLYFGGTSQHSQLSYDPGTVVLPILQTRKPRRRSRGVYKAPPLGAEALRGPGAARGPGGLASSVQVQGPSGGLLFVVRWGKRCSHSSVSPASSITPWGVQTAHSDEKLGLSGAATGHRSCRAGLGTRGWRLVRKLERRGEDRHMDRGQPASTWECPSPGSQGVGPGDLEGWAQQ